MKYGLLLLLALFASCNTKNEPAGQAKQIVGRQVVRLTAPPERIPTKLSVDAPLVGNGSMGATFAGQPELQTFYLARNDFWRLKSAHSETYPALPGKIELSLPTLAGASYLVEQDLYRAVTTETFSKDGATVKIRLWQAATDDVLSIELSLTGKDSLEGSFRLLLPDDKEIVVAPPLDIAFPEERELREDADNGLFYAVRAFEDSVDIPTRVAIALRNASAAPNSGGRFVLTPDKPVVLVCATSSNFKSDNPLSAAIDKVNEALTGDRLAQLEKQHFDWWQQYWEKSWVDIPDSLIERHYYLSLYGTASASRDKDFPPGLFGMWITGEQPCWMGDYHLNYNFQAPFYALYSANRLEQAAPYYSPILAMMERGRYYSEKIADIPDGIMYPVGIGPVGIETTRWSPLMEKYAADWRIKGNIEYDGMFWGQKTNASYCVVNMAFQFYRTWNRDFAASVYPFVKAAATFWEKYLRYEDGRYNDYNDAVHEATVGDKNPILGLGFVRQTMQTALDMSELLGVDAERREKWAHVRDHVAPCCFMEHGGKKVFRLTETGIDWVTGNSLALQHIYPGEQLGPGSDPELLQIARNTLSFKDWLDMNASNSIFPTAVRVGVAPDTILYHLRRYVQNTMPNGFQKNNPHGVENWSTTPNTVNEMLCMGYGGIVRLFPVWPRKNDARFYNIRIEGAFLVSAEMKNGEVCNLSITSEQGRPLNLLNPWPGRKIRVKTEGVATTYEGEQITVNTTANTVYIIEPK